MAYIQRTLESSLKDSLATRSLVYLNGARQCGKSTLARNISTDRELNYVTFDNPASLFFAKNDPAGFLQQLPQKKLNVIDEVQLAPELFRYLKMEIDEKRFNSKGSGQYLLIGSANIFALPKLSGALAGRMSIMTLFPFSASEIKGTNVNFVEKLWNDNLQTGKYPVDNITDTILSASFPEIAINKRTDRFTWFNDYITTILQRDVRTLADIKNPDYIYRLLVSFSQRAAGLLNNAGVMKETGLDAKTYEKYKALCAGTFIIFELPSWNRPNKLNKKFVKQKKLFFTDTSLLCHIMQRDIKDVYKTDKTTMGHLFENFVATEIMKAAASLGTYHVSHFNPVQNQGKEVDFVIENRNGQAIGIEVKLDGTINGNDWANMNALSQTLGKKFLKGIVIYTGTELLQLSRNIWAVPVNYLHDDRRSALY